MPISFQFCFFCAGEFRRVMKKEFYAAMYRNAEALKIMSDFSSMYLMGGEL